MKSKNQFRMCLNCGGDGYIINSSGKTRECEACNGIGNFKVNTKEEAK